MEIEDFGARFAIAVEDVARAWPLISEVALRLLFVYNLSFSARSQNI